MACCVLARDFMSLPKCDVVNAWSLSSFLSLGFLVTKPEGCLVHSVTGNALGFGREKPQAQEAITDNNATKLAVLLFGHCFTVEILWRQQCTTFLECCVSKIPSCPNVRSALVGSALIAKPFSETRPQLIFAFI